VVTVIRADGDKGETPGAQPPSGALP
jgi:hypothetical protein